MLDNRDKDRVTENAISDLSYRYSVAIVPINFGFLFVI